jgi:hypothetical protein
MSTPADVNNATGSPKELNPVPNLVEAHPAESSVPAFFGVS